MQDWPLVPKKLVCNSLLSCPVPSRRGAGGLSTAVLENRVRHFFVGSFGPFPAWGGSSVLSPSCTRSFCRVSFISWFALLYVVWCPTIEVFLLNEVFIQGKLTAVLISNLEETCVLHEVNPRKTLASCWGLRRAHRTLLSIDGHMLPQVAPVDKAILPPHGGIQPQIALLYIVESDQYT